MSELYIDREVAVEAHEALSRGDTAEALRLFRSAPPPESADDTDDLGFEDMDDEGRFVELDPMDEERKAQITASYMGMAYEALVDGRGNDAAALLHRGLFPTDPAAMSEAYYAQMRAGRRG